MNKFDGRYDWAQQGKTIEIPVFSGLNGKKRRENAEFASILLEYGMTGGVKIKRRLRTDIAAQNAKISETPLQILLQYRGTFRIKPG